MRGDFTRFTFDAGKDFSATLMQQGRVQLDADWNEQQAIHRHLRETADGTIIGRFGVRKGSSAFAITLASGGADLGIGRGLAFLVGQAVENRAAATLLDQPWLKLATATRPGIARPTTSGRYVAYLEVRDRHVTAELDPSLRESALGGPDTATRLQTIWQVRLAAAPSAAARCADLGPSWQPGPAVTQGMLVAETPAGAGGGPCILPPTAGYRALDNQHYRVEVHRPGPRDGANPATVKWSRENGSVATTVTVSGQVLTAASLGPDELLGFLPGQWVEIADAWMELADGRGRMLRIHDVDPATSTIEIEASTPVPVVDSTRLVLLTRWDQQGNGLEQGIAIGAAPMVLEAGLQLRFQAGDYAAGQYWLIPARTAIGGETGRVEWPAPGGVAAFLPPHGPRRQHAALAIVDYNATTQIFTLVDDCRPAFPPLTDIDATDVGFDNTNCSFPGATTVQAALDALCARGSGVCTIEARPGDDIHAMLDALPAATDARLCLATGRYDLDATLRIEGKGHVLVQGGGAGTLLVAAKNESALRVSGCASITLRDCAFEAGLADASNGLAGAVAISDCGGVEAEGCVFRTIAAARRGASGLSVIGRQTRAATIHVTRCRFEIGHLQIGLLARDGGMVRVTDNRFLVIAGATGQGTARMARLVAELLGRMTMVPPGATPTRSIAVSIGSRRIAFTPSFIPPGGTVDWQGFLNATNPPSVPSAARARAWLRESVEDRLALLAGGAAPATALDRALAAMLTSDQPAMSDAIVVSGQVAEDVAVTGNRITGALRGVTVATSDSDAPGSVVVPERVRMEGNSVELTDTVSKERRFGLFCGSAQSITMSDNRIAAQLNPRRTQRVPLEGIRVWGAVGSYVCLRENHITGARIGLRFVPIEGANPEPRPAWTITENLAARATTVVSTPSTSVRSRVRGIAENLA